MSTLEDDLIEAGELDAVETDHQCEECGTWYPAFGLANVKDNSYWPSASYVCGRCVMNFRRVRNKFVEDLAAALAPPRAFDPKVILKEKRRILTESLWATANDGTVTKEEAAAWRAYRKNIAAIDHNNFTGWPEAPE